MPGKPPIFYRRIAIYGDSIVWGSYDLENGGWVDSLKRQVMKKQQGQVYNRGISGLSTNHLLKILQADLEVIGPEIVIFSIGVNDSRRLTLPEYKKNLHEMLNAAKAVAKRIIFLGLTRVDDKRLRAVTYRDAKPPHQNKTISLFDKAIKDFCVKNKVPYIPLAKETNPLKSIDGLHPNTKDHAKIFKKLLNVINKYSS